MKIRCRILDNLKACGALRMAGTEHELDLSQADIERLTERGVIQPLDIDDDVMLLGSNVQPSVLYTVQGVSVPLGDVVRAAWHNSNLSAAGWNALSDTLRELAIDQAVFRMNLHNLPLSTAQDAGNDTSSRSEFNARESGTRQGTGAAASLPAVASSAGDAVSAALMTRPDVDAVAGPRAAELPPAGGEAKPASVDETTAAPGGNTGSADVGAAVAAETVAAKPARKSK